MEDNEGGLLVYERDSYRVKDSITYVPQVLLSKHYGLQRGHIITAQHPHRENESCRWFA
jgi:hypothetical protein